MASWMPLFYLLCYFGENVTTALNNLDYSIYERSWYLYPLEFRQYVVVMMMAAQKPIYFEGVARLQCSRADFKLVCNIEKFFFQNLI